MALYELLRVWKLKVVVTRRDLEEYETFLAYEAMRR